MGMHLGRFLEHSGDEAVEISAQNPVSLKRLEGITSFLLYEEFPRSVDPTAVIRVGQMRDIALSGDRITFRFAENGRIPNERFSQLRHRLQITDWEMVRSHWAVKDGEVPQDVLSEVVNTPKSYDIALSFAGEDRPYVSRVAALLEEHGVVVFYDEYEMVTLWGKDLAEQFDSVYRLQGRYCVMFVSKHYAEKTWTQHERRSAFARALESRQEYVLPARFDDTELPGLRSTIGYIDLRRHTPEEFGWLILQKLGRR